MEQDGGKETKTETIIKNEKKWRTKDTITVTYAFCLSTLYLMLGAYMFSAFEQPEEVKRLKEEKEATIQTVTRLTQHLVNNTLAQACGDNFTECYSNIDFLSLYVDSMQEFRVLLNAFGISDNKINLHKEEIVTQWDFAGAFYFCITTVTTIGYGNVTPTMNMTKLLTCGYALIGIPLFLFTCGEFYLLFKFFFRKLKTALSARESVPRRTLYYALCGSVILIVMSWLPFATWRTSGCTMSFTDILYFSVVSLSTIGYGDIFPTSPHETRTSTRVTYCFILWIYMIIALALFGNLIALIQNNIEARTKVIHRKITDEVARSSFVLKTSSIKSEKDLQVEMEKTDEENAQNTRSKDNVSLLNIND